MKNRILYIIFPVLALLYSCNDFLAEDPSPVAQLDTPASVSQLLTSAYPRHVPYMFMEIRTDNVGDNRLWTNNASESRPVEQTYWWEDVTVTYQDSPEGYWNECYKAIAAANQALEFIMSVDETNRSNYNGQYAEALMCRAYSHFMLVTLFAKPYNPQTADSDPGVPFVTEPETQTFKTYKRESVAEIYRLIENDILEGIQYIDNSTYSVPKYHFNRIAANAFATRFFVFKHDWEKAVKYASSALGESPVSLLRDWNGKYSSFTYDVLRLTYTNYQEPCNLLMCSAVSGWSQFNGYRYQHISSISQQLYGTNVAGSTAEYAAAPMLTNSNANHIDETFIVKFKQYIEATSINSSVGYPYVMAPILEAEEVLLNRAEAYAMLGQADKAIEDLNIYYSKRIKSYSSTSHVVTQSKIDSYAATLSGQLSPYGYTIPSNVMNLMKVIVDSRHKEFLHEGFRWFDILRYNIEVVHSSYDAKKTDKLKKDDYRRQLQIPTQAVAYGLEPNPR